MDTCLYKLLFGPGEQWRLGEEVLDAAGKPVDPWLLAEGGRLDIAGELRFPIRMEGPPLDVTFTTRGIIVVTERIGALVGELAPDDVQRIPARVDSRDERYEILSPLSEVDCIDREHTIAQAMVDGKLQTGTVASLGPLIEGGLSTHVVGPNLILKTEGLEGPRLFRVAGWRAEPLVTGPLKEALEGAGATGVTFTPMRTSP